MHYANLDDATRHFMVEEVQHDIQHDRIYLSTYLTQRAQGNWSDMLLAAALSGDDRTLEAELLRSRSLNAMTMRRTPSGRMTSARVPHDAAEVLAEGEFNRFYIRGLSRRAIEEQIPRLQVYRAKAVQQPRQDSEQAIGLLCEPQVLLADLRGSVGVETALGIPPGPRSGLTVRIP